ncbi:hypothetical protein IX51_06100 [uncultured archaeon]|nr:hypothetical protein IX51_06100 [uncultured archaeon]
MNWYNLSPAIGQISRAFGVNFAETSLLFSFFLFGAGTFQIPAGILATRIGSKKVAMSGLFVMAFTAILSTFSPSYFALITLRFITGFAAAFFFSSAIGILNELYQRDITKMVGIYNGFFAIGGGVGIFLFTPIVNSMGWRMGFLIAGLVTLVVAAVTTYSLPKTRITGKFNMKAVTERLTDKTIWLVALGLDGLWGLNFTFSEYFKSYAIFIGQPEIIAGLMGGMILFLGIVGGYLTGALRKYSPLRTVSILTTIVGASIAVIPFLAGYTIWMPVILDGVFSVVIVSMEYGILIRLNKDPRYVPLSLGTVNSIQIGFGSLIPFAFAFLNKGNYTFSWIFLGLLSIVLLPLLWLELRNKHVET